MATLPTMFINAPITQSPMSQAYRYLLQIYGMLLQQAPSTTAHCSCFWQKTSNHWDLSFSLLFSFLFSVGVFTPVVCHKPPRTSVELSLQIWRKCRIRHTQSGWVPSRIASFQETFKERGYHLTRHSKRAYQLAAKVEDGHSWGGQLVLCLTMACYTKPFAFSTNQSFIVLAR